MRSFVILLIMLACLFGPTAIFTLVGYKALQELGKRPSHGADVMIPLLVKLVATAALLLALLMVAMVVFAPKQAQADENAVDSAQIIEKKAAGFVPDKLLWIDHETLRDRIKKRSEGLDEFHLVDLRLEADYAKGALEGAVNVPFAKLTYLAEKLMAKADDIVLYGYPGNDRVTVNSLIFLVNKGFESVYVLKGGYSS